jgi:PAS domain S-box-containing protein
MTRPPGKPSPGRAPGAERRDAASAARRYELLASHGRDIVIFVRRDDGRILEANAAALNAYGYDREELLSLTVQDLRAPATRPLTSQQMAEADAGGLLFETVHQRKDGTTFPVEVSSRGAVLEGERVLLSIVRDVSDRRRAEDALRETEIRYRSLFEQMIDGFAYHRLIVDEEGRPFDYVFLEANAAFEQLTGLKRLDILGKTARQVLPGIENDPADWIGVYGSVALSGRTVRFEQYAQPLDRWYAVSAYSPKRGHFVTLFEDITERRRREESLRLANLGLAEADERKNEFLAMLSHELRNPLTPVRNSLYVLEHAAPGGEQARHAQAVIARQVDHLARLVDDLLDVTRITRGKVQLRREPLELRELVRRTVEDHRSLFVQGGLTLSGPAGAGEELWVDGDGTRLAQVIGNLLQNAAKFTPPGGRIELELQRGQDGRAVLRVRDTGAGIDPAVLPRLFAPFMQLDTTLDRSRGGLGLGLALVRGLVEQHGGEVRAASEGPGRGAEFTVLLPLRATASRARTAAQGEKAEAPGCRLRRVLVVDDNVDAATSLCDTLGLMGHTVEVAFEGTEALRKARAFRPEVILCDIGLPGMDGFQVARALRADPGLAGVALVALTGYASPDDVAQALASGFDLHMPKPPDLAALERAVGALGHRPPRRTAP